MIYLTLFLVIWVVFIDNIGENSLATTDANSDVIIFVATAVSIFSKNKNLFHLILLLILFLDCFPCRLFSCYFCTWC